MSQTPASQRVPYERTDPHSFGSERGLFRAVAGDRKGDDATSVDEFRKNADFLRLKDYALAFVDPRPGLEVLDLGCSDGAQMVYCALQGATVYGQDLNRSSVEAVNRKLRALGASGEARVGDARALEFESESFDVVLSSDFHEHLPTDIQIDVLREAHRVLRAGGVLVVKTPNLAYLRLSLWAKRARALLRGRDPRGYVIPHTSSDDPDSHVGLVTRAALGRQLAKAGFQNWQFHYPPLRRLGVRYPLDVASAEIPYVRDLLCEDLVCAARRPIALSYFPD